ncbi:hypothetical protein [Acidithiobacillus ferriphilus]|nr:hypothetical protein [Acidithiobacillus ferriphilus]MEB8475224.1 hypothetical protein [Acidithiobacillus ferriphilus]
MPIISFAPWIRCSLLDAEWRLRDQKRLQSRLRSDFYDISR